MQFGLNHAARALIILLLWALFTVVRNPVLAEQMPTSRADAPRLHLSHLREQYGEEIHKRNWSSALLIADEAIQTAEHKLVPYDPLFASLLNDRAGIFEKLNQLEQAKSDRIRSNEIWTRLADLLLAVSGTVNSIDSASIQALCPRADLICAVAEGLSSFGYYVERYQQLPYSEQLLDKGFAIAKLMPDARSEEKTLVLGILSRLYWPHNRLKSHLTTQAYLAAAFIAKDPSLHAHALIWASKLAMLEYDPLHARKYANQAVDIELKQPEPGNYLCTCLEQLALAEEASGNIASAIDVFEETLRSMDIGTLNSVDRHFILESLSNLFCLKGDVKKARICFELSQKLNSSQENLSEEYLQRSALLGWIEHLEGNHESARTRLQAVIGERAKLGDDTFGLYTELASVDASLNKWTAAQLDSCEAARDFSMVLNRQLTTLLFNEQISLINDQAKPIIGDLVSCAARSKDNQIYAIYASILPFKGLLYDRLKRNSQLRAFISTKPDLQKLVEEIQTKECRLALIRLKETEGSKSEIVSLTQEKINCERALAAATLDVPLLRALPPEQSLKILDSLSADETFVDIYKYKELDSKQVVYCAFVSRVHTQVQMISLGTAAPLEVACRNWLGSMRTGHTVIEPFRIPEISAARSIGINSSRTESKLSESTARKTVQIVLAPLLKALQTSPKCILSLDGDTFRLPWELLLPVGTEITEVDSVNQLASRNVSNTSKNLQRLILAGDIKYQNEPELTATKMEDAAIKEVAASTRISVVPIEGVSATRSAVLKSLPECTYAHLATHGYFIDKKIEDSTELTQHFNTKNVLQDAGLLLADEPVTAGDLAEIDLSGCNQVVLSACETGIGETSFTGQGILGLRSALTASGARTLLVSLWKVDDEATSELMKLYYQNLWELKQSPSHSLTAAQKRLGELKAEWKQPYYWAGWILVGKAW